MIRVLKNLTSAAEPLDDVIEAVAIAAEHTGRTPLGTALRNLVADLSTQRRRLANLTNVARGLSVDDHGSAAVPLGRVSDVGTVSAVGRALAGPEDPEPPRAA